jgi:hypothetical protein
MAAENHDLQDLRTEIGKLLAAALEVDLIHVADTKRREELHVADMERRDELHVSETERRDVLHTDEMTRRQDGFEQELASIREALETRELIGEAKGIIIAAMGCSRDEAFLMLKHQSQAENRKVTDLAVDIVAKAQRKR